MNPINILRARRKSRELKEFGKYCNDNPKITKDTIDNFHRLYYNKEIYPKWLGVTIAKLPSDLIAYQEIIFETRPDVIIECGTLYGGSALFLATMLDLIGGKGKVITIDRKKLEFPQHPRISYLTGKSVDKNIFENVKSMIGKDDKVMVVLDSDHSKKNVLKELKMYSSLVTKGCFMVVEDTNINGNPVDKYSGAGPKEAVEEFLEDTNNSSYFIKDSNPEKYLFSYNAGGYLRRCG